MLQRFDPVSRDSASMGLPKAMHHLSKSRPERDTQPAHVAPRCPLAVLSTVLWRMLDVMSGSEPGLTVSLELRCGAKQLRSRFARPPTVVMRASGRSP